MPVIHNKYDFKYIDEIYAAEHIEHCVGEFAGLTSEGEVVKTLFGFHDKISHIEAKRRGLQNSENFFTTSELESDFLSIF